MSPKSLTILGVAVALGGVLAIEESRLASANDAAKILRAGQEAAEKEAGGLLAESEALKKRNDALADESAQLRAKLAAFKKANPALAAEIAPDAVADAKEARAPEKKPSGSANDMMKGLAKMFTDPEMKKAMRAQQSMGVRMIYGDLTKELGLTTQEADQVLELLADRQIEASAKALGGFDEAKKDPAKVAQFGKEAQEAMSEYDGKIKGVLGEERMKKFNEYERTMGDRMALQQYQGTFASAGVPLEDGQRSGLLGIMKEERMRHPPGPLDPGNKDVAAQMKALQSGEGFEETIRQQRELNQRVLARAHTVLTPDQMNALEAAQKTQMQMQEMQVKMSKAMFGGGEEKK